MPAVTGTKPRIYMDSCCFIDMAKHKIGSPSVTHRANEIWHYRQLLRASRDGHISVVTSTLTIAECQYADSKPPEEIVKVLFSKLLMSGQYVSLVQPTPFIAADARDLLWNHGISLKGADGLHVASALERRCIEFISTDGQLQKERWQRAVPMVSALGLRCIAGAQTASLPDAYRQDDLLDGAQPGNDDV
jgi:PIN domain